MRMGALPRLKGFCPEKWNPRSEFFLPIPRLPLTLAVQGSEMFRTAQYAVEFAQEHGWNVVSVIER